MLFFHPQLSRWLTNMRLSRLVDTSAINWWKVAVISKWNVLIKVGVMSESPGTIFIVIFRKYHNSRTLKITTHAVKCLRSALVIVWHCLFFLISCWNRNQISSLPPFLLYFDISTRERSAKHDGTLRLKTNYTFPSDLSFWARRTIRCGSETLLPLRNWRYSHIPNSDKALFLSKKQFGASN